MRLLFSFILGLLFCATTSAQKFDGYVVTRSNDTIQCKFFVVTNLFTRDLFYAESVRKGVKIETKEKVKIKFKPSQLLSFLIKGTNHGDFKFVSFSDDGYKFFYHEIVKGKLSYYRLYTPYQDMVVNNSFEQFVYKDNKLSKINRPKRRDSLGEFIKDYPELYDKWMSPYEPIDINSIDYVVEMYNEHFKK